MDKRGDISQHSKGKLASGLMRGAVLSGVTAAMAAAASLGGGPTASATCIGISGINIGGGCNSTLGNFALVLGTGTAETSGFFTAAIGIGTGVSAISGGVGTLAYSGGTGTQAGTAGILNLAVGQGTNVAAFAGLRPLDVVNIAVNIGSAIDALEFDSEGNPVPGAYSWVQASDGAFNLAGNLGGNASNTDTGVPTPLIVWSGGDDETLGFGTVAANVFGNRNEVQAIGTLLNATAWGNAFTFPNGSDNIVHAGAIGDPQFLSWAFSYQGVGTEACDSNCGNEVNATGPGAIAGAVGVVNRTVNQDGPGVSIATQFNDTGTAVSSTGNNTNALAASGTQANRVRLNSTATNTNALAASGTPKNRVRPSLNAASNRSETTSPGGPVHRSVSDSIKKWAKKFSDPASRSTSGLASNAKADADSTDSDK